MKFIKIIAIISVIFSTTFLSGCHTAHGFGQDVAAGGESIQKAAS